MDNVTCIWEEPAILGEGPLWVAQESAIYWVDIFGKKVHRYGLADGSRRTWPFAVAVTSLAQRRHGGFVGTVRDGFAFIDLDAGKLTPIALPEANLPGNRFNDGKVDADGRYWAGTMDEAGSQASGALYRLDGDLSLHPIDDGYIISNGPTFSVDGKTLYHTDTRQRVIYAFDLAGDGQISNKRIFIQFGDEEAGLPDGMTVDSDDCLWVCHFGGARVTRFSPAGEVLAIIPMPVPNITSCTFAGPDLDTLYITTARLRLSDEEIRHYPLAGSLFSYRTGVTGLATPAFAG